MVGAARSLVETAPQPELWTICRILGFISYLGGEYILQCISLSMLTSLRLSIVLSLARTWMSVVLSIRVDLKQMRRALFCKRSIFVLIFSVQGVRQKLG